jgi:hypothetical protein
VSNALLPCVCAWCERVRSRSGCWEEADPEPCGQDATHGICPECLATQTREAAAAAECR